MKRLPLSLLLFGAVPASAAEPTTSPVAATAPAAASGLQVSADLRDEYLQGQPVLVMVTLTNNGDAPLTVPDLTARPWRVKFRFTLPSGQAQNRFSTPPAQEPTATWTIPARGQKRVLLEVPSGAGLKSGAYTLAIDVDLGEQKESLTARPIRIAAASPQAAQLAPDVLLNERDGMVALWVHKASAGYDLYMAVTDARAPERGERDQFLLHLDQAVEPTLTAIRSGDADRYVVWANSERSIGYARLRSGRVEGAARSVDLPWPKAELIGQGATQAGNLHQPVWVPAPKGTSGELRLVSVDERGRPQLRKMTTLTARPAGVSTVVDVAGGVHVLVQREDRVDLYTLRPDYPEEVPIPGERLWVAEAGQRLETARYGSAPQSEGQAGGLAVLVAWTQASKLESQWVSLQGKSLQRLPGAALAEGARVLRVLPNGLATPGLVTRGAAGSASFTEGTTVLPLSLPSGAWEIRRDLSGRPVLLSLEPGAGVRARVLEPVTAQP